MRILKERIEQIFHDLGITNVMYYNQQVDGIDKVVEAISKDNFIAMSYKALEEQKPAYWDLEATESDGYRHKECGIYQNAMDAFIEAVEHSPSYHTDVSLHKLTDEEITERKKQDKEFYSILDKSSLETDK